LLVSDHVGTSDRVWNLYRHLDTASKDDFRMDVLRYLARSERTVEAWRVTELFSELGTNEWTEESVNIAIKANLSLENDSIATQIFTHAVNLRGIARGLDSLLACAFRASSWARALDLWGTVRRKFDTELPSVLKFDAVAVVPDFSQKLNQ